MLEPEKTGIPPQEDFAVKAVEIPKGEANAEEVVFYYVKVFGTFNNENWTIKKRYSQFEEMYYNLQDELSEVGLPKGCALPPKKIKLLTSHTSQAFIEERRILLENFMKKLINNADAARSNSLLSFLKSDKCEEVEVKEASSKILEDVEVTGVSIPQTRLMSDHVLYQVDVTNDKKRKSFSKWTVLKRFVQFWDMDQALRLEFVNDLELLETMPPTPERKAKIFNDHMDPTFVEERRVLLESYLQKMIKIEKVVKNETFLSFLGANS